MQCGQLGGRSLWVPALKPGENFPGTQVALPGQGRVQTDLRLAGSRSYNLPSAPSVVQAVVA